MARLVVLLFGPPGAGKSTTARELSADLGLQVFDRDDPHWHGSEARFRRALRVVGADPQARAVVIRSGATSTARARSAQLVRATHGYLLDPGPNVCAARVRSRSRSDFVAGTRAVATWYSTLDRTDRVPSWRGVIEEHGTWHPIRLTERGTRYEDKLARYGYSHQAARTAWAKRLPCPCTVCGEIVTAADRWDLDHNDDGTDYLGPAHRRCNRRKGARKGNRARARATRELNAGGRWLSL